MSDSNTQSSQPKRRRSGQPGNVNAHKNGFYARRVLETGDPHAARAENLLVIRSLSLAALSISRPQRKTADFPPKGIRVDLNYFFKYPINE